MACVLSKSHNCWIKIMLLDFKTQLLATRLKVMTVPTVTRPNVMTLLMVTRLNFGYKIQPLATRFNHWNKTKCYDCAIC